jgi:hypothetical protein
MVQKRNEELQMKIISRSQTTKYDIFKMANGNRDYSIAHAVKLANDIKENNMLEAHPILCIRGDNCLLVYDGQHRLAAAKKLGIPIPYIIAEGLTCADIATLNRSQKGWGTKDYVKHFSDMKKSDYVRLQDFVNAHGLPITLAVGMLSKKIPEGGGLQEQFRSGRFRIESMERAEAVVGIMNAIKDAGCPFTRDRSFVKALYAIYQTGLFQINRLLLRLKYLPLEKAASWQKYVEAIDYRYNYRALAKDKVPLLFEATKDDVLQ